MPEPTGITPTPIDYTTLKKEQLVDMLAERDGSIKKLEAAILKHAREMQTIEESRKRADDIRRTSDEERQKARDARGAPKLLGKIDVFDVDDPEDVLARAQAIRAGHVPLGMAKRFKTNAHIRAPKGSKLAKRLGAREDQAPDVPLRTEFDRDEMPAESLEHFHKAGAILAIA